MKIKTRSTRSYQREIKALKNLIESMQWVRPTYNGNDSCASCGNQRHHGCDKDCDAAKITKDFGEPQEPEEEQEPF